MEVGFVELLRAAWIVGTLSILIASLPSSRLSWFHDALSGFAKRGKTLQSSSKTQRTNGEIRSSELSETDLEIFRSPNDVVADPRSRMSNFSGNETAPFFGFLGAAAALVFSLGFVVLLRAAWIVGTLPILIASLPSSWLRWFRDALSGFAKRGKTLQPSSKSFTIPQRFFCHFYWLAVVWTSLLLVTTWMYAYTTAPMVSEPFLYSSIASYLTGGSHISSWHKSRSISIKQRYVVWRSVFLLLLMEVQVLRRLFETIYVFNYSLSARMHVFAYLTGLFFYTAAPLSLCCNCIPEVYEFVVNGVAEFIVRGKNQMPAVEFDWWEFVNPLVKLGWRQWIGVAIFFWGWVHQRRCHAILGSLRGQMEQVDEYVIPNGDWFESVSSPHYLAEIVIYASLVVASGGADITIWLLFAFVVANLVFAAAETHRWYLRKFDNYPSNRRVIIPFIY